MGNVCAAPDCGAGAGAGLLFEFALLDGGIALVFAGACACVRVPVLRFTAAKNLRADSESECTDPLMMSVAVTLFLS